MVTSPVRPTLGSSTANRKPELSTATVTENLNLPGRSPLEVPMGIPLFGTDGIRGRVGEVLTTALALQAGYWAGQVLKTQDQGIGPVVVGQDSRTSGDMLAAALAAGLASAGLEVWNLGLCPTPCVAYITATTDAIGGVMVSASHNPPGDNGIKFFGASGTKLSKGQQQAIEAAIRQEAYPTVPETEGPTWGAIAQRPELVRDYARSLETTLHAEGIHERRPLAGLRIVLDTAWGAAVRVAPAVFRELGAEVINLNSEPDGSRINVDCGSTHLGPLKAAVLRHQADLGFGFDGDADRVLAVDDRGRTVDGDAILFLWGRKLKAAGQLPHNLIVTTVMANLGFERAWQREGGTVLRTAVGDQYVHQGMVETGAALGGEQSGHLLCSHYGVSGDGTLAAVHLAALVREARQPLSQLVDDSFTTYPQLLKNVRVEDRDRRKNWQDCSALMAEIATAEAAMGEAGRILVRPSGTEPLIRVMVEAADSDLAHYWADRLAAAVTTHLT